MNVFDRPFGDLCCIESVAAKQPLATDITRLPEVGRRGLGNPRGRLSPLDFEGSDGPLFPHGSDDEDAHWDLMGDTALTDEAIEPAADA